MKVLLVIFAIVTGILAVDDYNDTWTEAELEQIFTRADIRATASTPELITSNNYSVEVHETTTDDGYILQIHRIPASPTSPAAPGKPVMFLMHGILSTSADWIETGPGRALGYILADAGFDVWMGNARGNTYSRHHTTILSEKDFWSFSFHEIGYYDLPAMIDYALAHTGQKQLGYIGHSQGTTTFFVMTSMRPSYNDKIKVMFALAPIGFMGHLPGPVLRLAALSTNTLLDFFNLLGIYEVDPSPRFTRAARAAYCAKDPLSQRLCSNIIFLLCGFDIPQMNVSVLPTLFGHTPAGGAIRQLGHYGQEIQSHRFRQFDYGPVQNLLTYGSVTPPDYDLRLITAPVHLVYSDNDFFAAPVDVSQLYDSIGNPTELWHVSNEQWSHFDYVWGIDAPTVIYAPLLERLKGKYYH